MSKVEPFGQVAVRLGYATQGQVETALEIQQSLERAGKGRKLLGMILLETGTISSGQLINILQYYERHRREPAESPQPAEKPPEKAD